MQNKLTATISLILTAIVFFALVLINNQVLSPFRLDLTENQVYSLSDGSKQVLAEIDEPINLYFFFSDKASKNMTSLRNYANRVESLLTEYETIADGKLKLHIIDPQPFSEQEDQATKFGLTGATIGNAGEAIYMGLAATNAIGEQKVIAFFDPKQESFLEYEISKIIHQLSNTKRIKVTLLTDLNIAGGQNPMTGQTDPAWTFYTQLQQLNDVELVGSEIDALPQDTDLLIIIHPKGFSEKLLYAIDQYALKDGRVLLFMDPHNESDQLAMMTGATDPNSSSLEPLLDTWGLEFDSQHVLLDAMAGLDIRTQAGGVTRHFGFVGLGANELDRNDITTSNLEIINGASFGTFTKKPGLTAQWLPLMKSTSNADLIDANIYSSTTNPEELAKKYQSKNTEYVLAGRLSGKAKSAFKLAPEGMENTQFVDSTNSLNLIVVGDTDLLADRFWVQQANFFGQTVYTPFANNGDFVTNAVENLSGSNALISIRSRGTFARPFIKVDELTVKAEKKFREQELLLQRQLDDTEQQLMQLQSQQEEGAGLVISAEQQQAIDNFMEQKIEIRKELREVRHQLDKDIETLGNWLKFINIAVAPLILVILLAILSLVFRTRSSASQRKISKEAK